MEKKIYVNKITKRINNNQNFCEIQELNNNTTNIKENINNDSLIKEKLNNLFNINGYIFNKNVEIITKNKKYSTKIAGKVNNYIITLDNDIINISDIMDINY